LKLTDAALQEMIITKAWEDSAFKAQLIADPKGAIKQTFGVELPQDVDLEAVTETSKKFYLVIPPTPADMKSKDSKEAPQWP
jgi:hypothetical protein